VFLGTDRQKRNLVVSYGPVAFAVGEKFVKVRKGTIKKMKMEVEKRKEKKVWR
jgi:hypothetical protein